MSNKRCTLLVAVTLCFADWNLLMLSLGLQQKQTNRLEVHPDIRYALFATFLGIVELVVKKQLHSSH